VVGVLLWRCLSHVRGFVSEKNVTHTLGCFDWSLASLCRSDSIVMWTLKTSLNVGVPLEPIQLVSNWEG